MRTLIERRTGGAGPEPRRVLASALVAILLVCAAAPAAGATQRRGHVFGHAFVPGGTVEYRYGYRATHVDADPTGSGAGRRAEVDVRIAYEGRLRPGRLDRWRSFARGLRRLERPYLVEAFGDVEVRGRAVQTVTGWLQDVDEDGDHGLARFRCVDGDPIGGVSLVLGHERRVRGGWGAFAYLDHAIHAFPPQQPDACEVTSDEPGRAEQDGWRESVLRTFGNLVDAPQDVASGERVSPDDAGPTGGWNRLARDSGHRFVLGDRAARRRALSLRPSGGLPESWRDCGRTLEPDGATDWQTASCAQDYSWSAELRGRRDCARGRTFFGYTRRGRRAGPGTWGCLLPGRALP